eukprot:634737-Hanusia_phi.AAC.1
MGQQIIHGKKQKIPHSQLLIPHLLPPETLMVTAAAAAAEDEEAGPWFCMAAVGICEESDECISIPCNHPTPPHPPHPTSLNHRLQMLQIA